MAKLGDGDVARAGCPAVGCRQALPLAAVRALLSKADMARYERLLAQQYVDTNPRLRWCPPPHPPLPPPTRPAGRLVHFESHAAANGGHHVVQPLARQPRINK